MSKPKQNPGLTHALRRYAESAIPDLSTASIHLTQSTLETSMSLETRIRGLTSTSTPFSASRSIASSSSRDAVRAASSASGVPSSIACSPACEEPFSRASWMVTERRSVPASPGAARPPRTGRGTGLPDLSAPARCPRAGLRHLQCIVPSRWPPCLSGRR